MHITNRIHLIYIFLVSQCFQSALIHVPAPGLNTELGTSDSQHLQAPFKLQTQIQTLNYSEQSLTTCHAKPRANKPKINLYPTPVIKPAHLSCKAPFLPTAIPKDTSKREIQEILYVQRPSSFFVLPVLPAHGTETSSFPPLNTRTNILGMVSLPCISLLQSRNSRGQAVEK